MINRVKNYRKNMKCFMIYLLSVAALFVSGFYLIKFVSLVNEYGFQNMLSMYAEKEKLIYFLVCFLQPIILPLPEPVTIMGGSSLLGSQIGATIGFIGTFFGIISMFFASKYVGKAIVSKLVDEKKLEKFNKFIQKNEMLVILMLFILPILPDEVICVGSGIAGINTYKFIGVAAVSKLITSVSLSYSLDLIKFNAVTITAIIILVLAVLLVYKYKDSFKEKIYYV